MKTYNPYVSAANEMIHEAEESGVLLDYLDYFRIFPCDKDFTITERRELVKKLVEAKAGLERKVKP